MTYNLIDQSGFLIKSFNNIKTAKRYIKDHNIKNYIVLKT